MEVGGLRVDVNVSVRLKNSTGIHSYSGVTGLGKRTEIKNLSSFKAVEDAIVAERDRQIAMLESGGTIEGETRGWVLGSTETKRLRGKEGEVDYRYMPDSDLPPVIISQDLIHHIKMTLPMLPDEQTGFLINHYRLSMKDAKTMVQLDDGERLDYFYDVVSILTKSSPDDQSRIGKLAANWILHELSGLMSKSQTLFHENCVSPKALAAIVSNLDLGRITGRTAKQLLSMVFEGDAREVETIIMQENLELQRLSDDEYRALARALIANNADIAGKVRSGQTGKLQWFVGQMVRAGEGRVEAQKATKVLRPYLGLS